MFRITSIISYSHANNTDHLPFVRFIEYNIMIA